MLKSSGECLNQTVIA